MADTAAATGLTVQQWDDKYFKEHLNMNLFRPYMGRSSNSMIQVKEDLTKKKGDSITFALVNRLTNTATQGSATLEGNEEDMASRSFKVTVDQYRHAVRVSVLEEQFSAIGLRNAAKDVLMDWNMELNRDKTIAALSSINGVAYGTASETQKDAWLADNADRVLFGAAKSNNSSNDHSASLANIDNTADKFTSSALSLMKRMAKTASPKIRPIKPRSSAVTSDYYICFAPSLLVRDLAADTAFQQANREARQRGKDNPLFKGADYVYDNILIVEVEDIPVIAGVGAAGIDVAPAYLCGAQAIGMAWAKRPETVQEEFDYKDKMGCAIRQIFEIEKMRFGKGAGDTDDLVDHGVFTGYFAAVADS